MVTLSQQNGLWGNLTLGKTPYKVSKYGCLITSLSMLTDYFGDYKSPKYFAKYGTFTKAGMFDWNCLPNISKLKLLTRYNFRNDIMIKDALREQAKACILQVNKNHFVVALGTSLLGGYRIADPWDAKKKTTRAYNNNITGVRVITTK